MGKANVTFDDVLDYYHNNDLLLLGGLLGSSPYACIDYFQNNGYSVFATKDMGLYEELAVSADACILWCCFDTGDFFGIGAHFVAFKQYTDYAVYYNAYVIWLKRIGAEVFARHFLMHMADTIPL